MELNHQKKYDYCFIGSIDSCYERRKWVIDFAKKNFTKDSIFINTDNSPNWELLGTFDYSNMNLSGTEYSINTWPSVNLQRSPNFDMVLIGDSSGKLVTVVGEDLEDTIILATSPNSGENAQVTVFIEDGDQGEIWIAGNQIISFTVPL